MRQKRVLFTQDKLCGTHAGHALILNVVTAIQTSLIQTNCRSCIKVKKKI